MERKWNKIDLEYKPKNEIFNQRLSKIKGLRDKSIKKADICNILDITKQQLKYSLKKLVNA